MNTKVFLPGALEKINLLASQHRNYPKDLHSLASNPCTLLFFSELICAPTDMPTDRCNTAVPWHQCPLTQSRQSTGSESQMLPPHGTMSPETTAHCQRLLTYSRNEVSNSTLEDLSQIEISLEIAISNSFMFLHRESCDRQLMPVTAEF